MRNLESHGSLNGLIGAISSDAALAESLRPKLNELTTQVNETMNETERVKNLTAEMSKADLGCHQLAFVTEVFKGISALLNVKKRVLDTAIGLAKDVTSDVTANKAKGAGASPTLAFISGQVVKNLPELNSASKLAGNAYGIMADAGAFVSDTLFGMYCEQFTGPVEGIMNARFFEARGGNGPTLWWSYNYSFLISVTGVLEKNAITIVLGAAKSDISPVHRVTVLILSPLTGGLGKVRNFIDNAADREAMKLPLRTNGDTMIAESVFSGKVDKKKAQADYTLKVKACNPGC